MEQNKPKSEMIKIKNADRLSTLKEKDKSGREESAEKENSSPVVNTESEDNKPATDPIAAKQFPHMFAAVLFLFKIKEPVAPIANAKNANKNNIAGVSRFINIFDKMISLLFVFQISLKYPLDGKVSFWAKVDHRGFGNQPV